MKGKMKNESGGKMPKDKMAVNAGGNPDVMKEAEERKHGGRTKKHVGHMHSAKAKHRLDKPGRKLGGRVGADRSPLSSAHKGTSGHTA